MLGVGITAAIIIVVSGLIFYKAMFGGGFGGITHLLDSKSKAGGRIFNSSIALIYVVFIVAVPLIFIIGNNSKSDAQIDGIHLTAAEASGRELFADHCAVCHTLAADNAVGKIGPNLDQLSPRPTVALIEYRIANGCLQKPSAGNSTTDCLGYGTMPADIVQGEQASDIAKFVAAVAGHA